MEINSELLGLLWNLARGSDDEKPNLKAIELLLKHQGTKQNPYEFMTSEELVKELKKKIKELGGCLCK